jgi:protein-tyrosine phosphatase
MPHPKGGEQLEKNIKEVKEQGYEAVISMLTQKEQSELCLDGEKAICEKYDISYFNYPIRDEVADSDIETLKFIDALENLQKQKSKIVFHCRGGVGRSSMILSLLAARLGVTPQDSFELITKSRGELAPESAAQKQWVIKLSET